MGFDKDDPQRIVKPERRTTKVNLWMAVAIATFFLITGIVVWRLWQYPPS